MKNGALTIAVTLILAGLSTHSQSVHYLRCLSVNILSDVTITWEAPVSAPEFTAYRIFYAENPNPPSFQEIAYIDNLSTNSFVHVGGAAGRMVTYYYIETLLSTGGSLFSDTLRTIFLETADNGQGEVVLTWNSIHSPSLPSTASNYNVWIEYPLDNWSLLGSTSLENYIYEISICDDSLSFQIVLLDDYGCSSASNLDGGRYQDIIKPPMPIIDSVSVDLSDQELVVGWQPSSAGDAIGYLIYRYINNNWIPIDTLWGRDNTLYKDLDVDPCIKSEAYALAALDSCGNKSLGTFLIPQQSILLDEPVYSPCDSSNRVSWSAYINMQPPLLGYDVFVSIENGPFQHLGTTQPGQTDYTHEGLEPNRHYAYYVRAFNNSDYGSSSCIKSVYAYSYARPSYHYLANVSVEENQYIGIKVLLDSAASIQGVKIYRKDDGNFEEMEYITPVSDEMIYYEDLTANVQQNSYPYQVSVVDSCGYETLFSNILPSILLQGQFQNQGEVYLEWTAFSGWDGGLESYEVYRVNEGVIETTPLTTLPPAQTQYMDNVSGAPTTTSSFDYVVAAVEAGNNSYGLSEVSYSNILQLQGSPRIFMPNAFRPDGLNRVFKPVGNYIDQTNYLFQVFDRWGRLVFETRNFNDGWDGSYKGRDMPSGVYVYLLNYRQGDGSLASLKGSFTLIR